MTDVVRQAVIDSKLCAIRDMASLERSIEKKTEELNSLRATIAGLKLKVAEFDDWLASAVASNVETAP